MSDIRGRLRRLESKVITRPRRTWGPHTVLDDGTFPDYVLDPDGLWTSPETGERFHVIAPADDRFDDDDPFDDDDLVDGPD